MEWLDEIPMAVLVGAAALIGLAPFVPEPHLLEKYKMFRAGTLRRPLDIVDVAWHLSPLALILIKLLR